MDGMELVLKLENMENLYLPKEELKNTAENTIVNIECTSGVAKAYVNAVHGVRSDNVKPYGCLGELNEIKLGIVEVRVTQFMREYLQKHLKDQYSDETIQAMVVKALEVNVTIPCVGGATPSDVIALIDLALDKTMVFRKRKTQGKYKKVNTGCLFSKSKEYRVKVYDKTEEHGLPRMKTIKEMAELTGLSYTMRVICVSKTKSSISEPERNISSITTGSWLA